jgi:hypothetical protein
VQKGQLPLDLVAKDKALTGTIAPEFSIARASLAKRPPGS